MRKPELRKLGRRRSANRLDTVLQDAADHFVSKKWLQRYVDEYVWPYNHRSEPGPQLETPLPRATT